MNKRIDVQKIIVIHGVIPEEDECHLMNIHTHGLEKFNYPNLLVLAPPILYSQAGLLLGAVSDWLLNDFPGLGENETLINHTLQIDDKTTICFNPVFNFDEEVMLLDSNRHECQCDECKKERNMSKFKVIEGNNNSAKKEENVKCSLKIVEKDLFLSDLNEVLKKHEFNSFYFIGQRDEGEDERFYTSYNSSNVDMLNFLEIMFNDEELKHAVEQHMKGFSNLLTNEDHNE